MPLPPFGSVGVCEPPPRQGKKQIGASGALTDRGRAPDWVRIVILPGLCNVAKESVVTGLRARHSGGLAGRDACPTKTAAPGK
jgi:hypothetical protein